MTNKVGTKYLFALCDHSGIPKTGMFKATRVKSKQDLEKKLTKEYKGRTILIQIERDGQAVEKYLFNVG